MGLQPPRRGPRAKPLGYASTRVHVYLSTKMGELVERIHRETGVGPSELFAALIREGKQARLPVLESILPPLPPTPPELEEIRKRRQDEARRASMGVKIVGQDARPASMAMAG